VKLTLTYPDKVATPRLVRATVAYDAQFEQTAQVTKINWGDGTPEVVMASGDLVDDHAYAADGFYRVYARSNEVKVHQEITIGVGTMGPIHDPDNYKRNLPEAQAEARRRDALVGRSTPRVGNPKTSLRKVPR
jgi:hypothetical protein